MYDPPKTIIYDTSVEDTNACSVDVYHPSSSTSQPQDLVVFIHGGAWRTGDKSDHADIPSLLTQAIHNRNPSPTTTNDNVAPIIMIPNYRLSYHPDHPERATTVHPTHILDIARFFSWLVTLWESSSSGSSSSQDGESSSWRSIRNVYLLGHSCGAHILSHVFFSMPTALSLSTTAASASNEHLSTLRNHLLTLLGKTRAAAFLDGIYDLPSLISEYPTYSFFVDAAFGADQSRWAEAGVLYLSSVEGEETSRRRRIPSRAVMDVLESSCRVVVVAHATEDELLAPTQGKLWVDYLGEVGLGEQTVWDGETLVGTHDGCLHHVGLGELLYKLMRED